MHLFKTKYYTQHNLNMLFLFKVPLTILKEIYFLSKVVISCFSFSAMVGTLNNYFSFRSQMGKCHTTLGKPQKKFFS